MIPLGVASPFTTGATPSTKVNRYFGDDHFWANISDLGPKRLSATAKGITQSGFESASFGPMAEPGDLLFSFKLSVGTVSIAAAPMYTNEAIATFKDVAMLDTRYAYYMLPIYLLRAANYNIYGAPLLNDGIMQRTRVPVPDRDTQHRIADYLDRETGEIDAMIAKLDELAGQLEARKTAAIQRATQFDHYSERWSAVPTAHLFGSVGSGTTPKEEWHYTTSSDGVPWVTTSELREDEIFGTAKHVTQRAVSEISSLKVHPRGSIAIAMYGATIGRLGTFGVDAATNQACCVFSEPINVDMRFFYYTLWGQRDDIVRLAVGGGQPNISQTMLRRWRVPCPPIDEQNRIADHLDEVTGKIDAMLAKVAELKTLLAERRAALITDVVTGRKEAA